LAARGAKSALPPKADMGFNITDVCCVPVSDSWRAASIVDHSIPSRLVEPARPIGALLRSSTYRADKHYKSNEVISEPSTPVGARISGFSGLPVSTTHIVTSGIAGTMVTARAGLHFPMLRRIVIAWLVTLPVTILIAASLYYKCRRSPRSHPARRTPPARRRKSCREQR
jgi:hypothetical protein